MTGCAEFEQATGSARQLNTLTLARLLRLTNSNQTTRGLIERQRAEVVDDLARRYGRRLCQILDVRK